MVHVHGLALSSGDGTPWVAPDGSSPFVITPRLGRIRAKQSTTSSLFAEAVPDAVEKFISLADDGIGSFFDEGFDLVSELAQISFFIATVISVRNPFQEPVNRTLYCSSHFKKGSYVSVDRSIA